MEPSLEYFFALLGLGGLSVGLLVLLLVLVVAVLPLLYFLPSMVALQRRKQNSLSILIVNLYFGWTLIGWVITLIWAASVDRDRL